MRANYEVPLGEVLDLDLDLVTVEPESRYNIAGVYGFGRGIFGRGPLYGSETSYRQLNRLHADRLVMSRLKAFEGAVSVVPTRFDGWFLSPEFPTFKCRPGDLDPGYLALLCRWPEFWARLAASSAGIGARRERVNPEALLAIRVPLPSIDEQRQIATRLGAIAARSTDLGTSVKRAELLSSALAVSLCARFDLSEIEKVRSGWRSVTLGSVMALAQHAVAVDTHTNYPNLGIYSFGRGVFGKPAIDGSSTSAKTLYRVQGGQFLYSRLFAFEGAYAAVPKEFDGYFVSNEFPTFDPDPEQLDARWLAAYLKAPTIWSELAGSSKGLGVRRQRIPVDAILNYRVSVPPIEQQQAMVSQLQRLEIVQADHLQMRTRIDSLMPSALNAAFSGLS